MCQCKFINWDKFTTLYTYICVEKEGTWEIYVPSSQMFYEPKSAVKIKCVCLFI